jgi:hypothetical protein
MIPALEFEDRATREAEKAVEKYGDDAALETGHPDKDITDYAINELVGLVRYGEMIEARMKMFDQLENRAIVREIRAGIALGQQISEAGRELGEQLIALRQRLQSARVYLGEPEIR